MIMMIVLMVIIIMLMIKICVQYALTNSLNHVLVKSLKCFKIGVKTVYLG